MYHKQFCSIKKCRYTISILTKYYGTKQSSYSATVLLPKTSFPLRIEGKNLVKRDKDINELLNANGLYEWQRKNLRHPEFVLHDGPPYANGSPHMGHAINKILKDIILRYHILKGIKVHYVPGWDCHGLPIELKALENRKSVQSPLEIRRTAREFASSVIEMQKEVFLSWGVLGDWNNCYKTFSVDYIKNQLKQFYKLYKSNFIYRDVKPIHWSPSSKTALAESELEYNENHKSYSVFVKFEIESLPGVKICGNGPIYALIWTTTPWTLPSNQAVCFNPVFTYCLCTNDSGRTTFISAIETISELKKSLECDIEILSVLPSETLAGIKYHHPIYTGKIQPFLPGSHVTATKGTGLVHTAPAHGSEDFLIALKNKLTVVNLVDDNGCFRKEAGPEFDGKFVLDEGSEIVLQKLKNKLLHKSFIIHSYPYDWRTKKPVIQRASAQWFLDTNSLKQKAIQCVQNITFVPHSKQQIYKEDFLRQIEKRPFWCISRQRKWGVPIPVFYKKKSNEVVINQEIIDHQCNLLEKYGPDYWWDLSVDKLLPESIKDSVDISEIIKGEDIMDIWFDSGISWSNINQLADVYLEGGDQFNGWFYSSLMTSLACRDMSPYKSLYIHGIAVDKNGLKMSKSLGNVVDPVSLTEGSKSQKPYGVDVLRWWVACHANQDSLIHCSDSVLQSCSTEVQKIRSVLRFIVGALKNYKHEENSNINLLFIDRYMLHISHDFYRQIKIDTDHYAFNKIGKSVINFLTNKMSSLYYPAIKDRLYCEESQSPIRIGSQYTLNKILEMMLLTVGPILPHLVEEIHMHLPNRKTNSYFTNFHKEIEENWRNDDVNNMMELVLNARKNLHVQVGSGSTEADVELILSKEVFDKLEDLVQVEYRNYEIANILMCGNVTVTSSPTQLEDYQLKIGRSSRFICPRCRNSYFNKKDELCCRCSKVLDSLHGEEVASN